MKTAKASVVFALAILMLGAARGDADEPQKPPVPDEAQMRKMMQAAMEMAAPGEQHALLAKLAGDWKVTGRFFIPGQEGVEFTGTTGNKMILGGRFLQFEGSFTSQTLQLSSESLMVYGFDKRTGKYTLWTVDTMGTYSVSAEGDYDAATRTWTLHGEVVEPSMDKVPFKFVVKLIDDTQYVLELHMEFAGMGWHKQMEAMHEKD